MRTDRPPEVVVLGSANLDLIAALPAIPAPGETVLATGREMRAGGKGLNQAVAAARAGARTLLVGAVGDDPAAELLLNEAQGAAVDTTFVRRVAGPSGTAWIMVQPDGENSIVVDSAANASVVRLSEAELTAIASGAVLVAQLETPFAAVGQAVAAAAEAGLQVVLNAAPVSELGASLLACVNVLVVNQHEARQLSGSAGPEPAARVLRDAVRDAVVVTLGGGGCLIADAAGVRRIDGVVAKVVDTTGAGDTFTGVLAASLARGADLHAACSRAVVAGALAVERRGAVPSIPTAAEIDARLSEDRDR